MCSSTAHELARKGFVNLAAWNDCAFELKKGKILITLNSVNVSLAKDSLKHLLDFAKFAQLSISDDLSSLEEAME